MAAHAPKKPYPPPLNTVPFVKKIMTPYLFRKGVTINVQRLLTCLMLVLALASGIANAQLLIDITSGVDKPHSIAVAPFAWQGRGALSEDVAAIVESDMQRTGQFVAISRNDMLSTPHRQDDVFYRDWRAINADYLLVGTLTPSGSDIQAQFELFDVHNQRRIMLGRVSGTANSLRDIAHAISDNAYEKLTGIRGAFSTKLLYVAAEHRGQDQYTYRLILADIDGAREQVLLQRDEPIVTPTWSPDGDKIAYVSFESRQPFIFIQDLQTGKRTKLPNFPGLNSAPAWSPDGKRLAMALSKDGSPDIYTMDVITHKLEQLTRHFAIDTEPAWTPDGRALLYTSDRGGKPQIYQLDLASGRQQRLTFEGNYNTAAQVLPDGSGFVMVHREDRDFSIGLQSFNDDAVQILVDKTLIERPGIAPNGTMLAYAVQRGRQHFLATVPIIGGAPTVDQPSRFGEVRDPAWSPYLNE